MPNLFKTLFFLLATALHAQPYNFMSYSVADGLAQSQVYALCQDSRGYLWCGTQGGGLSRFDGLDFQTFNTAAGLPSDFINTLFEDSKKRLWIGTNAGFAVCELSQYCAGFKSNFAVNAICETAEGDIWLGTDTGIFTCKNPTDSPQNLDVPGIPKPFSVRAILRTSNGIWLSTNRGAFRIGGDKPMSLSTKNGLPSNNVAAAALDREARLWILMPGSGIAVWDEARGKINPVSIPAAAVWSTCLRLDSEGKMWVGTSNDGLFIFDPAQADKAPVQINEKQGLPHNHVRDLLLDRNDQMWVATSGGGIARVLSRQFSHYTSANGLLGNRVYALHTDDAGRIWLAASQNGLQMLDSAGFHLVTQDSGLLAGVKCKAITTDRHGNLWAGTDGKGLFKIDTAGAHPIAGLPSPRIQSILRAPTGDIWVATMDKGIVSLHEDPARAGGYGIKKIGQNEGLTDLYISTLKTDGNGNIWFGTQAGNLGFIQEGKLAAIFGGSKNELPELPVRSIAFDKTGRIWAGFRGGGVWGAKCSDLQQGSTTHFSPLSATLASQNIYLLQTDPAGHLWVGSEKGLDEVEFDPTQTATAVVKETRHYGRNEGFLGIETCQDAVVYDQEGNLWFGTMNGLTKYIPTQHQSSRAAPILHFHQIALFYKPLAETRYANWLDPVGGLREGLRFDWNENHLSFEFRAVDLSNPEGLLYRWKLEGAPNAEWSPFSAQQSVNFAGLQAGDYKFWAQAISANGTLSEPITASFSTKKPFWQTGWFLLTAGITLFGLVFLGVKSRIRQVRKTELEKREKLEVQNRVLQLEQKALQLQMNPHFIFNALNSVQSLVSAGDASAARTELNAFAQLMRSILSNSRKQSVTLREEADTLAQYLQIEQFCRPAKPFDFSIQFAEGIDPESIELPPMLLQPFVENAVLHGLAHLQDRPGNIKILFETPGETLRCTISDNGVGREKAALLRGERQPGHSSAALEITQERLEALAENQIPNPLEFSDIHDLSGEIAGTRVVVTLPLRLRW